MNSQLRPSRLAALAIASAALLPACTIIRVRGADSPPQVRCNGLIDGFLGFGMPEIGDPLEVQFLENGLSVGVNVFNLLRVEIGGLGFAVALGPVQLGLGTLFYDPEPVPYPPRENAGDSVRVEEVEIDEVDEPGEVEVEIDQVDVDD